MLENYPSLLVTKLYIPRLRSNHVSRAALLATLGNITEYKLVLVAAAAGFGKTTLLADWSQQQTGVCWVSLDEGDNEPVRFFSYLIAAVQTLRPHIGQELLMVLQSSQPPPLQNVLHSLVNQLAANPARLTWVLDDYHVIENQAIHGAMALLLERLPPQHTIVLLTRADPPLPLGRLRARNELLEVRAATLRFSAVEIEQFLNHTMHLTLSPEAIVALDARTEGWIAGLQLAAIALQTVAQEAETFIQQFTGSHRFVLEYLLEEVLARQPEAVRRFLLQTAFLRRLNSELCETVMAEGNGRFMLEYLEKNNLFLVPLDHGRYWYRYHHLFADLLQAHLQAENPTLLPELHRRAARWHAQNNLPEEAVLYALAGQDFHQAAQWILGPAAQVMRRGEVMTLLEWYRVFPPAIVALYPRLALQFGMAFALNGRWQEAETLLAVVASENSQVPAEETLLLTYLVAGYQQDVGRLTAVINQMLSQPDLDRKTKLTLALIFNLKGELQIACRLLAESQAASEQEGDRLLALTALFHQCLAQVYQGHLHTTHQLSHQALQQAHHLGGPALLMVSFAHAALSRVYIEWNELEKATEHLQQAIHASELNGLVTGMVSSCTMMLAEVKQAQGDAAAAHETAQKALRAAEQYDPAAEVNWLRVYQARIWLNQGNSAVFTHWLPTTHQPLPLSMFYTTQVQQVTLARAWLAQCKTEQAIPMLLQLTTEPPHLFTVEALVLLALARQNQADSVHALLTLEQALTLGEQENRIRVFLDLGQPMVKLLTRFCQEHPQHRFARQLLTGLSAQWVSETAVEPFSEREREVLRLIMAGYSNEEIAQTLTVALSTVKWYINTLYSKLHVKTRSQAIVRAREILGESGKQ